VTIARRFCSMIWTTAVVCVVATVALALATTGSGTAAAAPARAHASASESKCCFLIAASSGGQFSQNYGTNLKVNGRIGTEEFEWYWFEKSIFEYWVSGGEPVLEPAETESGHFAPVLEADSNWTSKSAEASQGSPTQAACDGSHQAPLHKLVYNGQLFYEPWQVSKDGPPDVWKAFQGHRWVLRIGGFGMPNGSPGYTPCGFYSDVPVGLEAPPGNSYGVPDQASQLFGPYTYYVKMPPRSFLSRADGAPSQVSLDYVRHLSFTGCLSFNGFTPCLGDNGLSQHMTDETTDLTLTIEWFPSSQLQAEINKLKRAAGK
jgi:hypothetical protein